jgi:hypothetical protein
MGDDGVAVLIVVLVVGVVYVVAVVIVVNCNAFIKIRGFSSERC